MARTNEAKTSRNGAQRTSRNGEQRLQEMKRVATLMKQVSDPTRLQNISLLFDGEMFFGAVCNHFDQSQPAVSHHLALLRHGDIVAARRQGQHTYYALTSTGESLARLAQQMTM
jgi:DNA-binding transcriptional ArsR family regulator